LKAPSGPIRDFYRKDYPTLDKSFRDVEFLAIDIECTGLDEKEDDILSIGMVPVIEGAIRLSEAEYYLVRPRKAVPEETAVIHGILDGHLEDAPRMFEILPHVLRMMTGRVAIAHHQSIESKFLTAACRFLYRTPLVIPYVDTMRLEMRLFGRNQPSTMKSGAFRLDACRQRYKLPRYRAHNALIDAISSAELFLAQAAKMTGKKEPELRDLLG